MERIQGFLVVLLFAFAVTAAAQTKWDMPTPYPATNFHTELTTLSCSCGIARCPGLWRMK